MAGDQIRDGRRALCEARSRRARSLPRRMRAASSRQGLRPAARYESGDPRRPAACARHRARRDRPPADAGPLRRACSRGFQAIERRESLRRTQAWITSAVNQSQRLDDEFELANPAKAELDIAIDHVRRAQLGLDLPLHRTKLAQRFEIEIAAIDETVEFADQAAPTAMAPATGRARNSAARSHV